MLQNLKTFSGVLYNDCILSLYSESTSCSSDQLALDSSCVFLSSELQTWQEARARCKQVRDQGWHPDGRPIVSPTLHTKLYLLSNYGAWPISTWLLIMKWLNFYIHCHFIIFYIYIYKLMLSQVLYNIIFYQKIYYIIARNYYNLLVVYGRLIYSVVTGKYGDVC